MMLSPLVQAGALQNSPSPVDTRGGGDGISLEPFAIPPLFHFAHFRKVNVLVEATCAGRKAPRDKGRASRRWNPNCSCSVRYRLRAPQPVEPTL
jgi:hypothetical protein